MVRADPGIGDVPLVWRQPEQNFVFTLVDGVDRREIARRSVAVELSKYRIDVLKNFLNRVWIVDTLKLGGVPSIGTQGAATLWIAVRTSSGAPLSEWDIRSTVHHELACQIFDIVPGGFPEKQWREISPAGYRDVEPIVAARQGRASTALDLESAREGFLTEYARTGVLKDFATFHEFTMMAPEDVCYLAKHEPIRRKLEAWEAFVSRLQLLKPQPP